MYHAEGCQTLPVTQTPIDDCHFVEPKCFGHRAKYDLYLRFQIEIVFTAICISIVRNIIYNHATI